MKELVLKAEGTVTSRKQRAKDVYEGAFVIDGLRIQKVPVDLIDSKKYQRKISETNVAKIMSDYKKEKAGVITVVYNKETNTFDVIDGQHRAFAAKKVGMDYISAMILEPMSVSKAAKELRDKEVHSKRVTAYDVFKANLLIKGSDEDDLSRVDKIIHGICEEKGIKVNKNPSPYNLRAIFDARIITKKNPKDFELILDIIKETGWNKHTKGYPKWCIRGIYNVMEKYKGKDISKYIIDFMRETNPYNYSDVIHAMYPDLKLGGLNYETKLSTCLNEYVKRTEESKVNISFDSTSRTQLYN